VATDPAATAALMASMTAALAKVDTVLPPAPVQEPMRAAASRITGVLIPPRPLGRPLQIEPAVAEPDDQVDRITAMSALHVLCASIEAERACPTELHWAGLSVSAAEELARLINATRSL
jgi:hypothetical protein